MLIYYAHANVHHVPKCMSCHKATVVITGRAHCFQDCIYIYIYKYYIYIYMYIYIHMVFTTEGFFEGAIERWNPRPLNSVQTL